MDRESKINILRNVGFGAYKSLQSYFGFV